MKKCIAIAFFALLAGVLLNSCSTPKSIIKLEPKNESSKWLYGQNFVADSLYGVIYEVSFDQLQDNQYWFDFNIINRSNMAVLVDPALFYCLALDSMLNPITTENITAINPEDEIFEIEKELSKKEARSKNKIGLSLMAAGIDIVSEIAVATDDNPRNNHLRTHLFYDAQRAIAENEFEAQNLNELMDSWKNSTIRKTTLESNFSMHGKVFFSAFPDAAYIKLFLPVDEEYVEISFKQTQFPVR